MLISIFYISLSMLFYVYVGYPFIAYLLTKWRKSDIRTKPYEPLVSIVIAAFNEQEGIAETIWNKLSLDYPQEMLEIIVISDGSTDETENIVNSFAHKNVQLLRQEPRAGKTSALNMAMPNLKGEIVVFSDANSLYDSQAVKNLMKNFADPAIGYVTGKMIYVNPDGSSIGDGCSAYMKYENFLRGIETDLGSVVGVDGGIDAIRKELYKPMNADQLPDFVQPLKVIAQGYRVVYEPSALMRESALKESGDEYLMRVRVSLRALWALWDMRELLWGKNCLFAWQLWSHKLLRYLCFIFMFAAVASNLFLVWKGVFYVAFFLLQIAAYCGSLLMPWLNARGLHWGGLNFVRYFLLLNVASAHAFSKFICGRKQILWTPRKG